MVTSRMLLVSVTEWSLRHKVNYHYRIVLITNGSVSMEIIRIKLFPNGILTVFSTDIQKKDVLICYKAPKVNLLMNGKVL